MINVRLSDVHDTVGQYRIGYALNPKKLRKSNVKKHSGTSLESDSLLSTSYHGNKANDETKGDLSKSLHDVMGLRKWHGGGLADILNEPAIADQIIFHPWDPETPPDKQPFFHVIIHKLTEDLDREESRDKIEALRRYLAFSPRTVLLDPLDSVRKVISRSRTCHTLRQIEQRLGESCPFSQPPYLLVEESESAESVVSKMILAHINFPVICKPVAACGTPTSHQMAVLVCAEDVATMLPRPCVLQQYYDHGGSFFKVYVIDEDVMTFRRSSLPDLAEIRRTFGGLRSVVFDSRFSYPTPLDFTPVTTSTLCALNIDSIPSTPPVPSTAVTTVVADRSVELWKVHGRGDSDSFNGVSRIEGFNGGNSSTHSNRSRLLEDSCSMMLEDRMISQALRQSAQLIRDEFGLTLFGFDVLVLATNARPIVVDVNYFPSYKEVDDFPARLRAYLRKLSEANDDNLSPK